MSTVDPPSGPFVGDVPIPAATPLPIPTGEAIRTISRIGKMLDKLTYTDRAATLRILRAWLVDV